MLFQLLQTMNLDGIQLSRRLLPSPKTIKVNQNDDACKYWTGETRQEAYVRVLLSSSLEACLFHTFYLLHVPHVVEKHECITIESLLRLLRLRKAIDGKH